MRQFFWVIFLCLCSLKATADNYLLTPFPHQPPAPDFFLRDLQGVSHHLSDYRGKVVVLNFWATWCPPCRAEMPSMQRAWEIMRKENIALLAVAVGEAESTVREFANELELDFPMLLDGHATVMDAWPARGLPTTFVLNPEGKIAYRAVGGRDWDAPEILQMLRDLQNSQPSKPSLHKTAN